MDANEENALLLAQVKKNTYSPDPIKEAVEDIAFGSLAGGLGKVIEYPFDTVKVRLQSQASGPKLRYTGPLDCFRQSVTADGIYGGLFRGVSTPIVGAAIETSSLFFSYGVAQNALRATIFDTSQQSLALVSLAGAASGAATSLLLTPIELVKCRIQVHSQATRLSRPGVLAIIVSTFREGGILGFWHGQLGTLIRETGGTAVWFSSYEGVCTIFKRRQSRRTGVRTEEITNAGLALYQQLLAGAIAGPSYNLAFYPADTIKSRMQTEVAGSRGHATFWHVGRALWREQGVRGFYRGAGITVGRAAPSSAVIFMIYESLKTTFG